MHSQIITKKCKIEAHKHFSPSKCFFKATFPSRKPFSLPASNNKLQKRALGRRVHLSPPAHPGCIGWPSPVHKTATVTSTATATWCLLYVLLHGNNFQNASNAMLEEAQYQYSFLSSPLTYSIFSFILYHSSPWLQIPFPSPPSQSPRGNFNPTKSKWFPNVLKHVLLFLACIAMM